MVRCGPAGRTTWRNNTFKVKKVEIALKGVLQGDEALTERVLELVKNQNEY